MGNANEIIALFSIGIVVLIAVIILRITRIVRSSVKAKNAVPKSESGDTPMMVSQNNINNAL